MQQALAILFLGNSLTYTNDLPTLLTQSSPVRIHAESVTAPGATLQILYEQTDALQKLRSRKWDYVVLQEQGSFGIAAVNGARAVNDPKAFYGWSHIWDREIKAAGAKTVVFHSWTRKANPEDRPAIDHAFLQIARDLKAILVPVGLAWARLPQDALYVPDGLHPTIAGSYLAACVFTEALLKKSCVNPPAAVPAEMVASIRGTAAEAVQSAATLHIARPEYPALPDLPPGPKHSATDFVGVWTGETRFYRDPSKLTLKITPNGNGCRISYNVEGPEMQYVDTTATCVFAANGIQITITQPSGIVEMHTFNLRDGAIVGVSRLAPYTAYFRREASWTLRKVVQ